MRDMLTTELRHAARALARSPLFTLVAVLSLALGMGATTAVFSLVNGALIRPLPYPDADELIDVYEHHPTAVCAGCGVGTSYAQYRDIERDARSLAAIGAYRSASFTIGTVAGAERWQGARVSASFFAVLGIDPLYGRVFTAAEDAPHGESVVLIGERLWRARYDGRADAIGRVMRVNGELHTIIGVMPAELSLPPFAELWLPLAPIAAGEARSARDIATVARLAPGVDVESAAAEIAVLGEQYARAYPQSHAGWRTRVMPLRSELAADYAASFFVMFGVVAFVLLVACANLANLLLARAAARRHELGIRAAVGATRRALMLPLLAESLLVSVAAAGIGLLVAAWALELFSVVTAGALPSWVRHDMDVRVLLFAVTVAIGTGLLFGMLPALQAARVDVSHLLADGGRASTGGPVRTRVRNAFVAVQVAGATVLVFGALFFAAEFMRIAAFDPGYDMDGLYGGRVTVSSSVYTDDRAVAALAETLTQRIQAGTGSDAVAFSSMYAPNWPGTSAAPIRVQGAVAAVDDGVVGRVYNVTPQYFTAHGIAVIAGRDFGSTDGAGAPRVGIVNASLGERLWPGLSPLGRRLHLGGAADDWITIVGVVPAHSTSPFATEVPRLLYVPLAQHPSTQPASDQLSLHMRFSAPPVSLPQRLRATLAAVDPDLVVDEVRSARESQALWTAPVRVTALVIGGLGAFAVLLAALGIYGVIAFAVTQRVPELGIRIALGASRAGITALVLAQAMRLAGIGLAFGALGAVALGAVLRSQFFRASAPGPLWLLAVGVLFMGVAAAASWLPARRAARIDPMAALRAD